MRGWNICKPAHKTMCNKEGNFILSVAESKRKILIEIFENRRVRNAWGREEVSREYQVLAKQSRCQHTQPFGSRRVGSSRVGAGRAGPGRGGPGRVGAGRAGSGWAKCEVYEILLARPNPTHDISRSPYPTRPGLARQNARNPACMGVVEGRIAFALECSSNSRLGARTLFTRVRLLEMQTFVSAPISLLRLQRLSDATSVCY